MCCRVQTMTPDEIEGVDDLKRGDSRLGAAISVALLVAIAIASTTFYLRGLEAAASILLH